MPKMDHFAGEKGPLLFPSTRGKKLRSGLLALLLARTLRTGLLASLRTEHSCYERNKKATNGALDDASLTLVSLYFKGLGVIGGVSPVQVIRQLGANAVRPGTDRQRTSTDRV